MAKFGERLENLVRVFDEEMRNICDDSEAHAAQIDAYIDQLETRVQVADRTVEELRERAKVAERQLSEMVERQEKRDQKTARLLSRLQVIKDQFAELETGDEMADRSDAGMPVTNAGIDQLMNDIGETLAATLKQNEGEPPRPAGRLTKLFGREHAEEMAARAVQA